MSELRLDYQNNIPFPVSGVVLLGFSIVVLLLAGIYFSKLSDQVKSVEAQLALGQNSGAQHGSAHRLTASGTVELAQEVKNANDALRHLSVPWDALFRAVESSGGNKVTLLGLEPDIDKREVKIKGEAKNFKAVMSYISQLQGQEEFGLVYLQRHDVQQEDPDKPVRFSILAAWQDKP